MEGVTQPYLGDLLSMVNASNWFCFFFEPAMTQASSNQIETFTVYIWNGRTSSRWLISGDPSRIAKRHH